MRIIEDFEAAKSLLSREVPVYTYPVSAKLRQGLTKTFGTDDPE